VCRIGRRKPNITSIYVYMKKSGFQTFFIVVRGTSSAKYDDSVNANTTKCIFTESQNE